MSRPLAPILVTAGQSVSSQIDNAIQVAALMVANKSIFDIQYDGFGVSGGVWIPGGQERLFPQKGNSTGTVSLTSFNTGNVSPAPRGIVLITEYFVDDDIPHGQWPVTIPQSTVSAAVTTTNQLVNDTSVAGTSIVEATTSGAPSSSLSMDNSGDFLVAEYFSSAIKNLIQTIPGATIAVKLGNLARAVEILGNLQVDGTSLFTGAITASGGVVGNASTSTTATNANSLNGGPNFNGDLGKTVSKDTIDATGTAQAFFKSAGAGSNADAVLQATGTGKTSLSSGGINALQTDGNNGVYIISGKVGRSAAGDLIDASGTGVFLKGTAKSSFVYQGPSGTSLWSFKQRTHGTATGVSNGTVTVTHNLGQAPDSILVTPNDGTAGSQTFAIWNVGATTFQIFNAANTPSYYWEATLF